MSEKKSYPRSDSLEDALKDRLSKAKGTSKGNSPSDYLIHRRVVLKSQHHPTGKTTHSQASWTSKGLVHDAPLPTPRQLVIAQIPPDKGYYLLYLDNEGNEITDTYHEGLEDAIAQAEWEFQVRADEWIDPGLAE